MTLEEDIMSKKVEIGAKRVEIEDLEVHIGLVARREELCIWYNQLEELYRLYIVEQGGIYD